MAVARLAGPSGGPIGICGGDVDSEFCSGVMNSFRLMLGVAFEAREIILIAARDGMARHEPVHRLAQHSGKSIVAPHADNRFRRTLGRRRVETLQLPTLQTFDAVAVP